MTREQVEALIEAGDAMAERLRVMLADAGWREDFGRTVTGELIDSWRTLAHPAPYDDSDPLASRRSDAV